MSERLEAIKAALGRLDHDNKDQWTEGGLPNLATMQTLTGFNDLKRAEVSEANPGFSRIEDFGKPAPIEDNGAGENTPADAQNGEDAGPSRPNGLWEEGSMPADLAQHVKDPVFLIEAAMAAMNADPNRYQKNSELASFMRHYTIAQVNIKAHQARIDKRFADAEKAAG